MGGGSLEYIKQKAPCGPCNMITNLFDFLHLENNQWLNKINYVGILRDIVKTKGVTGLFAGVTPPVSYFCNNKF